MEQGKNQEKTPEIKEETKEKPEERVEEKTTTQEAKPKKEEAVKEKIKVANCLNCNKALKKRRWYYRDGKYYCNKRCWRAWKVKAASKKK